MGSEQGSERPVLVVQSNVGNTYSPTIIWIAHFDSSRESLPVKITILYLRLLRDDEQEGESNSICGTERLPVVIICHEHSVNYL